MRHMKAVSLAALLAPLTAAAADDHQEAGLGPLKAYMTGWLFGMIRFLRITLGILALLQLVRIVILIMRGEKAAAGQLAGWFMGLAGGWAVLAVIGSVVGMNAQ